ncbi:MAG: hypothetical protein MRY78_11705 [Saprospiraceae bacterium]|nr:hypothetical protein [Saprospiraceae bacterium]
MSEKELKLSIIQKILETKDLKLLQTVASLFELEQSEARSTSIDIPPWESLKPSGGSDSHDLGDLQGDIDEAFNP